MLMATIPYVVPRRQTKKGTLRKRIIMNNMLCLLKKGAAPHIDQQMEVCQQLILLSVI